MATEIQQLLLSALTHLTKEYQKQSNEQIERENLLISALEQLQRDQITQNEAYQSIQKSYIESLQSLKVLGSQVSSLSEQNSVLIAQLGQLVSLLRK